MFKTRENRYKHIEQYLLKTFKKKGSESIFPYGKKVWLTCAIDSFINSHINIDTVSWNSDKETSENSKITNHKN